MKKIILLGVIIYTLFIPKIKAQIPSGFNYQAVIRSSDGNLMQQSDVSIRISILQGITATSAIYTETHAAQTNSYGLINLVIGEGQTSDNFSSIDWSNSPYFIKLEVDLNDGSGYVNVGTSQLLSVPYALHAKTVENDQVNDADNDPENELQVLSISNDTIYLTQGSFVKLPSSSVPQQFSVSEFGDTMYISDGNYLIIPGVSINNYDYPEYGVSVNKYYGHKITKLIDGSLVFAIPNFMSNEFTFTKVNTLGQELWTKTYVIDSIVDAYPSHINSTVDGGFISSFSFRSSSPKSHCAVIKCNANGDTLWTNTLNLDGEVSGGYISQTVSEDYLLGSGSFIEPNGSSVLAKLNNVGDTIWTKSYGSFEYYVLSITNILETSTNDILFTVNNILYKTNSNGDTLWTKVFVNSNVYSITETVDNKYLILAVENSDNSKVTITKLDTDKSVLWTKELEESQYGELKNALHLDNGDIYLLGELSAEDAELIGYSHGGRDIWFLHINSDGDIINSDIYGGSDSENMLRSYLNPENKILIISTTGSSDGNVPYVNITNDEGEALWIFTLDPGVE